MKLNTFWIALALAGAAALHACESRTNADGDPDDEDGDGNCVGICSSSDAGDAGNNIPGNSDAGSKKVSLEQLRLNGAHGDYVEVENLVVHSVSYTKTGTQGDTLAEFWVADEAKPQFGIWVEKFYQDEPKTYLPTIGDRVTLKGFYGTIASFEDRIGRRRALRGEYDVNGGARKLEVTKVGSGVPTVNEVTSTSGFGDAQGGSVRASPEYAGAKVHIAGPLTVTDAQPMAFQRIEYGQLKGYNGFEVTGGILVNNYRTFRSDGGCAWRDVAETKSVTFPNGITGVWDTYTHAPCLDAGTGIGDCFRERGNIPGADAGFTFVLYPQGCEDLVGTAQ